jgi:hypothetical protein
MPHSVTSAAMEFRSGLAVCAWGRARGRQLARLNGQYWPVSEFGI